MTSHELAQRLLALPDLPVVGRSVGQGSNEYGDEDLTDVVLGESERDDVLRHIYPANYGKIELIF